MTRTKWLSLVLSFATLIVVLSTAAAPAAQKVTIRMANWQFLEPGRVDILNTFISEFEELNPGVEIVPEAIPYSTYNEKIMNELKSGQGPDIFFCQEFSLIPWIQDGYAAPLDNLIDLSKYEFLPQQSSAVVDGKTYAVLYEGFPYGGLICNMKLFKEAGVEIPKTPEELITAAQKLTKSPSQWGLAHPFAFGNYSYIMQGGMIVIKGFGGKIVEDDGTIGVDSPEFIKGVEYLKKLYDSGGVPKGTEFRQQRQWFTEGNVAMVMDGCYWPLIVKAENPELYDHLEVAALPFPNPASPYETNWYVISESSRNKEIAAKFLEYLLTESVQDRWAVASGMGTGCAFTLDSVNREYPWFKVYSDASPYGVVRIYSGLERQTVQARKMVSDAICEVLIGKKTAPQAMADLKAQLLALKDR